MSGKFVAREPLGIPSFPAVDALQGISADVQERGVLSARRALSTHTDKRCSATFQNHMPAPNVCSPVGGTLSRLAVPNSIRQTTK
ncbi:hypothetical protein RvY_04213 [Ramazzottius varieornatus]|uniref:Uncharacterized protein n=1 Tax=Ramazzottius varieornatus TaxID=947166 RepID=A0A1D1V052_RAMVA|nr:hypothetical protein RvY_04213 [Ramazzottius varieornatus]